MLLFLLLLIFAGVGVAVYATENTQTHSLTFLPWHWSAVADFVPVVTTALIIGLLFLLYIIYSGLVHGVRLGSMRRRVSTREQAINEIRADNQRLREENVRLRSELRGIDRGVAVAGGPPMSDRPAAGELNQESVGVSAAPDRSRSAPPFNPRPTFGERVRAFFSGREPAGY